ncbi:hypothetical protein ATO10_05542 [Actibacterium atlanticum]|uniref:TIGR01620 family protein n=1 Tax=Actibacterium atlanticum TaxID=1461693 RepID=A0A058ZNA7_9RHOB|nr:TIGR01620 family protein [Actibacterium atlanticum]KCV83048.1 hypothetical protein ATO10_05542 [Actibacterium atlanticum]
MTKGPVLIDLDEETPQVTPATAPPVPDGRAMQTVVQVAARKPSRLTRFFWSATLALIGFAASVAAWDFVTNLIARNPILGGAALILLAAFVLGLTLMALRELAGFARLRRLDGVHKAAQQAATTGDLAQARKVVASVERLYAGREELRWAKSRLSDRKGEVLDADGLLGLAEVELMTPLDAAAIKEVEAAARQVATVTALVPLALADLIAALSANLRMIRRIAEIYGGRSGTLGNLRLTRAVMTHLVATGAVAVGDDMLGSIAGGGMLSKLSRRFGEGLVNGALTARVGVAAIEVCRPLPFQATKRPSVSKLVSRALTGLFGKDA